MRDYIPVLCAGCGQRWHHPAAEIVVVQLPGTTDEVWFRCPDCGPDHIELDKCSAALVVYVYEPQVIDCTGLADDDHLRMIVGLWTVEQAGQ